MFSVNSRCQWQIPLSTTLRGGALREWNHLLQRLDSLPADFIKEGPAHIYWPLESSGTFSVRSLRTRLAQEAVAEVLLFPHEVIWSKPAPIKVQAFLWMVYHKKLATIDNLQRRGIPLVNRCPLCLTCLESVDHLLWQCSFTVEVWQWISSTLSLYGPFSHDVRGLIAGWKGMNCIPLFSEVTSVLLHAFLWCSWLERNDRVFKDKATTAKQVAIRALFNVGRWLSAWKVFSSDRFRCWNSFIFDPG
ncbi:Putative ribonuclease H protein At1g65750 [Linum perenne]